MRVVLLALGLLLSVPPATADGVSILFVGNSLTYTNDLPAMVVRLAKEEGLKTEVSVVAFPNFSVADHLADGRAMKRLLSRKWDWVVVQQGPSAAESSRQELLAAIGELAKDAPVGTRVALLSVWPSADRATDFDRVADTYRLAAESIGGIVIPAGESWRHAWRQDPSLPFHQSDRFHPSTTGTFLAALTTYRTLFDRSPSWRPDPRFFRRITKERSTLTTSQLEIVIEAAAENDRGASK